MGAGRPRPSLQRPGSGRCCRPRRESPLPSLTDWPLAQLAPADGMLAALARARLRAGSQLRARRGRRAGPHADRHAFRLIDSGRSIAELVCAPDLLVQRRCHGFDILAGVASALLLLEPAFSYVEGPGAGATRSRPRRSRASRRRSRRCRRPCPSRPAPTAKTQEEKRFARADKDDDGRITARRIDRAAAQGVRQARHQRQRRAELRGMGGEDRSTNSPAPTRTDRAG